MNEIEARNLSPAEREEALRDFLHGVGWLLAKTKEPIKDVMLIKRGKVAMIIMDNGQTIEVNIEGYSWFGALRQILINYEL